jgi:hypothetical protein
MAAGSMRIWRQGLATIASLFAGALVFAGTFSAVNYYRWHFVLKIYGRQPSGADGIVVTEEALFLGIVLGLAVALIFFARLWPRPLEASKISE